MSDINPKPPSTEKVSAPNPEVKRRHERFSAILGWTDIVARILTRIGEVFWKLVLPALIILNFDQMPKIIDDISKSWQLVTVVVIVVCSIYGRSVVVHLSGGERQIEIDYSKNSSSENANSENKGS